MNFRADPQVVQTLLPPPFHPKLQGGQAVVGICLIRLENIRPAGLPALVGLSSENAAHRIAVEWTDDLGQQREGVFIPRRDTDALINRLAGGRLFPGEHHAARFSVVDADGEINLRMESLDGAVAVRVAGAEADTLPETSCFGSVAEASSFFEKGSLGYSPRSNGNRLDELQLNTLDWRVRPLSVVEVYSSFFSDPARFPKGTVAFDHALVMRDLRHEWRQADRITAARPA